MAVETTKESSPSKMEVEDTTTEIEEQTPTSSPMDLEEDDPLFYNLRDLTGFDQTPYLGKNEQDLTDVTRVGVQRLVNKIFTNVPRKIDGDGVLVGNLEESVVFDKEAFKPNLTIPREKPLPKVKAETRWEKFAQEKGIQKKKRGRMVYDEVAQDWVPRWGPDSLKNRDVRRNVLMEVKEGADIYEDPFAKKKAERQLQVAKQKLRQMRNQVEAAGMKMKPVDISAGNSKANGGGNSGRGKAGLTAGLTRAQIATGSMGKFDRLSKGEVKLGDKDIKKKRKIDTAIKPADEKEKYKKILARKETAGAIDAAKAAKFGQVENERKNRVQKARKIKNRKPRIAKR